jgi:hypothetical protein
MIILFGCAVAFFFLTNESESVEIVFLVRDFLCVLLLPSFTCQNSYSYCVTDFYISADLYADSVLQNCIFLNFLLRH